MNNRDFYQNVEEDYYDSEEWISYEDQLRDREEIASISKFKSVSQQHQDHNWLLLKQERDLPPEIVKPKILKFSNLALTVWDKDNYKHGTLVSDIYTDQGKSSIKLSSQFDQEKYLKSTAKKIYDLLLTESVLHGLKLRHCFFYEINNIQNKDIDWAFFELWHKGSPKLGFLILEDQIWECDLTLYNQSYIWRTAYKKAKIVDEFWQQTI